MALEGKQEYVDIKKIEFDKENPRIKRLLELQEEEYDREINELEIVSALMHTHTEDEEDLSPNRTQMTYAKLKKSIVTNQGILSPIIIKSIGNNTYKCIEGNTRLAIYKSLNEENPDVGCWNTILATTHKNIDADDENAIRLQSHLVPPRPWDPYSRAKFLSELKNLPNWDLERVSGICGMQPTEVQQYVDTYDLMEKHYKAYLEENSEMLELRTWSGFLELVKKHNAIELIKNHGFTLKDFAGWLHKKKIKYNNHVRSLVKIFNNEEARKKFLSHDSTEAIKVFSQPSTGKALEEATIDELMRELTSKISNIPWPDVERLMQDTNLLDECADMVNVVQDLTKRFG